MFLLECRTQLMKQHSGVTLPPSSCFQQSWSWLVSGL